MIWANTIATVLVALSVGYALGGRAADRNPTQAGLSRIVLGSAVLLAIVPFLAGPFLRASVHAFDSLSVGVFLGSLVGVSVLIAVPVLLLGMVSPYAVRLAEGDPGAIPAVRHGHAGVQDEGSQLMALALAAAPLDGRDALWVDLCAGPGGKAALLEVLRAVVSNNRAGGWRRITGASG